MTPAEVRNPNSAQNSLLITEIRDGLVVMNDGSFRAVVTCKSINFDLMSDREREAVEYSYQSFLNSLYFPVQIFIRSQRVDIAPYIDRLDKIRRDQDNMLLGVLMDDYINFIAALAEETNIMDKSFFVVIPFYSAGDMGSAVSSSKNLFAGMFAPQKQMHVTIDKQSYEKAKEELGNRVNTVINGLFQIGIRSVQLNTKELSELYYNVYNPDTAVREPLGDFENITGAALIKKGQGQAPQPNLEQGGM
jgi:type IV secretory pathway VirB4 component